MQTFHGISWHRDGTVTRMRSEGGITVTEVAEPSPETDEIWAFNQLSQIYSCGCGQPETAYELVRAILRLMPLHDGRWDECVRLVGSEGACHIVLDLMTNADLIEHGGGIGGSWIRGEGERLLAILEPIDDLDEWADRVDEERVTWRAVP